MYLFQREMDIIPVFWFTSKIFTIVMVEIGHSQALGAHSGSLMRVAGTQGF